MADPSLPIILWHDAKAASQQFYFTGVPCTRGHLAQRRVSNKDCTACERERQSQRAKTVEWQAYRLQWEREQRKSRGDEVRAKARDQYLKHRDRILTEVKRYQEANREYIAARKAIRNQSRNPLERKRNALKLNYGITLEEYQHMYELQQGCCGICGEWHANLCVDHCHATLDIRGLLCQSCNHGLGKFRDDVSFLEKAIAYLRRERDGSIKSRHTKSSARVKVRSAEKKSVSGLRSSSRRKREESGHTDARQREIDFVSGSNDS